MTEAIWVAVIMSGLGLIGSGLNGYLIYKANRDKKTGNNPHPCQKHENILDKLDDRLDRLETAAELAKSDRTQIGRRLERLENKFNGMK